MAYFRWFYGPFLIVEQQFGPSLRIYEILENPSLISIDILEGGELEIAEIPSNIPGQSLHFLNRQAFGVRHLVLVFIADRMNRFPPENDEDQFSHRFFP